MPLRPSRSANELHMNELEHFATMALTQLSLPPQGTPLAGSYGGDFHSGTSSQSLCHRSPTDGCISLF